MLNKNISLIFTICLAVIFKISFLNIAFLLSQDNAEIENLASNDVFKVGKSRRRLTYYISPLEDKSASQEQVAEKAEMEDSDELLKKWKLPVFTAFFSFIFSLQNLALQVQKGLSAFRDACSYALSTKKYLSISVLRI